MRSQEEKKVARRALRAAKEKGGKPPLDERIEGRWGIRKREKEGTTIPGLRSHIRGERTFNGPKTVPNGFLPQKTNKGAGEKKDLGPNPELQMGEPRGSPART